MRREWKNTDYFEIQKPTFNQLQGYFPWLNLNSQDGNSSEIETHDDYIISERWSQKGNILHFDALTRTVFFEMPLGWRLEDTHRDLFRIAHYFLTSPWESGILDGWEPHGKKVGEIVYHLAAALTQLLACY